MKKSFMSTKIPTNSGMTNLSEIIPYHLENPPFSEKNKEMDSEIVFISKGRRMKDKITIRNIFESHSRLPVEHD